MLPCVIDGGRSENGIGDDGAAMMNEEDDVTCAGPSINTAAAAAASTAPRRRLFTLQSVNSYGSTETSQLVDDGKLIDFDGE